MTDNNTRYTPELAADICKRISEGETLRAICREPGYPAESTVRGWSRSDLNGFAAQYAQARAMQVDAWADEIMTVVYRPDLDPADKRVISENLRWLLSKLAPTRYGERLLVAGDPANPIEHLHRAVTPALADLSDDALDALQVFCDRLMIEQKPATNDSREASCS